MRNTVTVDELAGSLPEILRELKETRIPLAVHADGETAAYLVPPDDFISFDPHMTREEAAELARGLALSELDIEAGRVISLEEASRRLQILWKARGEEVEGHLNRCETDLTRTSVSLSPSTASNRS